MATTGRKGEELVVLMPTKVGLLAEVANALSKAGVNILAVLALERDVGVGEFRFVASDEDAAEAALEHIGARVERKPVLVLWVPNETGALSDVVAKVAGAGVNVLSAYATTANTDHATVIMRTSDDDKALTVL